MYRLLPQYSSGSGLSKTVLGPSRSIHLHIPTVICRAILMLRLARPIRRGAVLACLVQSVLVRLNIRI